MRALTKSILIVDDNAALRNTLAFVFTYAGYQVQCAADGFSALTEMRSNMPTVLLSDLNMPGMSGFELLSVVRRRFPQVRVIAMSGAFGQDHTQPHVAADAFYRKGRGASELLALTQHLLNGTTVRSRESATPIWISSAWLQAWDTEHIAIACPECLRVFPQPRPQGNAYPQEACCLHCSTTVQLAFARPILEMDRTGLGKAVPC